MPRPSSRVRDFLPQLPQGHGKEILVGIDPGTRMVGYGALVISKSGPRLLGAGTLKAPSTLSPAARLAYLRQELDDVFACLRPVAVAIESGFSGKNPATALRIGEGRGVALACAAAVTSKVLEITPAEVKKTLVGNGQATKEQVGAMVAQALGLDGPLESLDASDALAVALTLHNRRRFAARTLGL